MSMKKFLLLFLPFLILSFPQYLNQISKNVEAIEFLSKTSLNDYHEYRIKELKKEFEQTLENKKNNDSNLLSKNILKSNTNVIVNGKTKANEVITEEINILEKGNINGFLDTNKMISKNIKNNASYINQINGFNNKIIIEGDLVINNFDEENNNNLNTNFLSMKTKELQNKEFELVYFDDIVNKKAKNWDSNLFNSCKSKKNYFIGGYCKLSNKEVSKNYSIKQKHSTIKIITYYHMFDNWNNEKGYIKINNEIVWIKNGLSNKKGINFCGNSNYNDPAFNIPVEIILPHNDENLNITFGSTLTKQPCEASYGFGNILIYIK